jgi:hypothetical protein
MRTILSSLLLLISCFLFGQQSYKKGYVINNNGDTIQGSIKEDLEEKLTQSINFKDETGTIKLLSIADIKEFGLEAEGNFRLVNYVDPLDSLKNKAHFAKFLMEGTYRLFSFRRKDDLYFIVANKDTSYLLYDNIMTPLGGLIERGNYQSLLAFFSRECSKVNSNAENVNFTEEAVLSFFVSLEKCNGNKNTSIIHYSKTKAQKNIILSLGGMKADTRSEVLIQALGQFMVPTISRKTSVITGLMYNRTTHEATQTYTLVKEENKYNTQYFEIPVLMRYEILQKAIQPYIYGGAGVVFTKEKKTTTEISLVSPSTEATGTTESSRFEGTLIAGAGINVRIVKNIFVNLEWHYDLLSHLPVAGLAYKISLGGNK